jgi:nucleotide-binding universal stress UspA family protein
MKILIALDCSTYADEIISVLSKRIWKPDTQLFLISVINPSHIAQAREEYLHEARTILNAREAQLKSAFPLLEIKAEILEGPADATIISVATEWQADLIVIGSHGDAGHRPASIGSVAASVVNKSPCSVEIVKSFSEQSPTQVRPLASSQRNSP